MTQNSTHLEPLAVVWMCGSASRCLNSETPGEHRGDVTAIYEGEIVTEGYCEMRRCVAQAGQKRKTRRVA